MNNDRKSPNSSRKPAKSSQNDRQVDFRKAQGSSRDDEADLRDVARRAAKQQNETGEDN